MAVHLKSTQSGASQPPDSVEIRPPVVADAAGIWQLVRDGQVLDVNSCYAYLLVCRDFAVTSRVAVEGKNLLGFVAAYIPPQRPDVLFVWQIGTAPAMRRRGLGKALLRAALQAAACRQVRFLEATITPSNAASAGLFRSVAADLQSNYEVMPGFSRADFGLDKSDSQDHEPEDLIRIGPLMEQR